MSFYDDDVEQIEIPEDIRNLELFKHISATRTPARTKDRELYMNKLLLCSTEDIKNVMFLNDEQSQSFRRSIESITASKQCERTIGKKCKNHSGENENTPDFRHIDNSRCWLCGFAFECNDDVDCEHLIPVTFAGLFTGIKSTRRVTDFSKAFQRAYASNYLYAHASCNRSKSDLLLITWDEATGKMVFNHETGIELQQRILNIIQRKYPTYRVNSNKYTDDMMNNYRDKMNIICDFINREYNAFLKNGLSMTDYIKYIVSMTQIYFSKKRLESMNPEHIRRESLNEIISINKEIGDEASRVFDIVKLNEIHTSAKKSPLKRIEHEEEQDNVFFQPKRLFNSPVANRTRSKKPRNFGGGSGRRRNKRRLSMRRKRT